MDLSSETTNDQQAKQPQGDATDSTQAAPDPDTSAPTGPGSAPNAGSDGTSGAPPEPKPADTPANPSAPDANGPPPTPPAAQGNAAPTQPFQGPGSNAARDREYHAQQVEQFARTAPDTPGHYVRLAAYFRTTPQVVAAYPEDFKLAFETERYRNSLLSQPTGQNPPSSKVDNLRRIAPDAGAIAPGPHQQRPLGANPPLAPQHRAPQGEHPSPFHSPLEQIAQYRDVIKSTAAKYAVDPQAIASIIFQEKFNGVWADAKDVPAIGQLALTAGYFGSERSIGLAEMKVSRAAKLLGLDSSDYKERTQAIGSLLIPDGSIDLIARNIAAYQKDIGRPLSVEEATVAHNAGSDGLRSYIKDEIPQAKIDASVYGRSWNYQGAIAKALQGKIDPAPDAK